MAFPNYYSIETPILQELSAVGGIDEVQYLYERLIRYFPQINEQEIIEIKTGKNKNWRNTVQKAGKSLDEQNLITRQRGTWTLTNIGQQFIENETLGFTLTKTEISEPSHIDIQEMLVDIGFSLGFNAQTEFEYYDVIWRNSSTSTRISHIFEVQSKGNIDSAFAKLKRGYEAQRSNPFLVISTERDLNRAKKSLTREFHDLHNVITILTFQQIIEVHQNIKNISPILAKLLET